VRLKRQIVYPSKSRNRNTVDSRRHTFSPRRTNVPGDKWQSTAKRIVSATKKNLYTMNGSDAYKWLSGRGITQKIMRLAKLGWVKEDYFLSRDKFGLPEKLNHKGNPSKVWLPEGLLIPTFDYSKQVLKIRVRRFGVDGPKYCTIPGSSSYTFDNR
jgi:DNA primase